MQLSAFRQLGKIGLLLVLVTLTTTLLNPPARAANDDDLMPVSFQSPKYPMDAVRHHIEGYASFEFDITPAGKVQNIKVLDSKPKGVFVQTAKDALEQWQYAETAEGWKAQHVKLHFKLPAQQQPHK